MAEHDSVDVPARPVDVDDLRRKLTAVVTVTRLVLSHLDDLGSLAYDVAVGERSGSATRSDGHAHTSTGDRRAKVALDRLEHAASVMAKALGDAERVVTAGPGADESLRGTMLGSGDGKTHPADVLGQLRGAQSRRRGRGEYVPTPVVDQPVLPDNRKGAPGRARKRKGKR